MRLFQSGMMVGLLLLLLFGQAERAIAAAPSSEQDASQPQQYVFYLGEEQLLVLRFRVYVNGQDVQEVWEKHLAGRFDSLDANGDGVLSGGEVQKIPQRNLLSQFGLVAPSNSALSPDFNPSDGKVTREEFMEYFERLGLEPFRVQINQRNSPNVRGNAVVRRQPSDDAPRVLFAKLDGDGDGALTADDFLQAQTALRRMDLDRDESISTNELVQTTNFFLTQVVGGANAVPRPQFLAGSSRRSTRQLAQQFLAARDGHRGGAKDNRLSFAELGQTSERLATFDVDGDGHLDFEETQQFLIDPPADVEVIVRLGNLKGQKPLEFVGAQGRVTEQLASLAIGKVQMEFAAQQPRRLAPEQQLKNALKAADRDNNGYLEVMEAQSLSMNAALFRLVDADNDGKLFQEEMLALYLPLMELAQACVELNVTDSGRDLFRILDTSNDGRLGSREFVEATQRIPHWDSNGDGKLAQSEIPQQFRLVVGHGTLGRGRALLATPVERTPTGGRLQRSGAPEWLTKMDRNGDGEVSLREFLGPPDVFKKLDADGNGLLDSVEATSFEASAAR